MVQKDTELVDTSQSTDSQNLTDAGQAVDGNSGFGQLTDSQDLTDAGQAVEGSSGFNQIDADSRSPTDAGLASDALSNVNQKDAEEPNAFVPTRKYSGPCTDESSGRYVYETQYFYDSEERLVREEERRLVSSDDSTPDLSEVVNNVYGNDGNLLSKEIITNPNSDIWQQGRSEETYEYDGEGKLLVKITTENNRWGTSHRITTYSYDESGHLLSSREVRNWNFSAPDIDITTIYDEQGNIISGWDNINNQAIPSDHLGGIRYSYVYDENGNVLSKTPEDVPPSEMVSTVAIYYSYDQYGNLLSTRTEYTEGLPWVITYTYECWEE